MSDIILRTKILHDDYTNIANSMFDVPIEDESVVTIQNNIQLPESWNIGLIFGESGCGKSTLLSTFGQIRELKWDDNKSIISELSSVSPVEASEILCSVGFSTIPAWLRPYGKLSTGQKFRADLARSIIEAKDNDLILIDEFTSVVDRNVAKAASNAIQKYIRNKDKKIILASCHADIIDWLQPDWVYNPTEALTHAFSRESLRRPKIQLEIFRSKYEAWDLFKSSHYLAQSLNKASKCFMVMWNGNPVAFSGILAFPHPKLKNAWRETRTVVLPDYQGLGIGVKISDYIGSLIKAGGGRYYSRTIHPAMVSYRINRPELWRLGFKGKKGVSSQYMKEQRSWGHDIRDCYSFEYIGPAASEQDSKLFWDNTKPTQQFELNL